MPNSHDAVVLDFLVSGVVDVQRVYTHSYKPGNAVCRKFIYLHLLLTDNLPRPPANPLIVPPARPQVQVTATSGYLNWAGYIFHSTEKLPFVAAKHAAGIKADDTAHLEINSKPLLSVG